jgi:hypothetical protein
VGIGIEIAIHNCAPAVELAIIPTMVADAWGSGHADAARGSREARRLAGWRHHDRHTSCSLRAREHSASRNQLFLGFRLWPTDVLPDENGDGVGPRFLMFLSAFGFFFSLLLRICPLAMTISLAPG